MLLLNPDDIPFDVISTTSCRPFNVILTTSCRPCTLWDDARGPLVKVGARGSVHVPVDLLRMTGR